MDLLFHQTILPQTRTYYTSIFTASITNTTNQPTNSKVNNEGHNHRPNSTTRTNQSLHQDANTMALSLGILDPLNSLIMWRGVAWPYLMPEY
jgi:hypothetical protein